MSFKDRWKKSLIEFSQGRYGVDRLSRLIQGLSLILLVLGLVRKQPSLVGLSLGLIGLVYFRTFSKNIPARYRENQFYLKSTKPLRKRLSLLAKQVKDGKTHRYLLCPNCDEILRLPKNKGKIRVTCPHCKYKFEKRV